MATLNSAGKATINISAGALAAGIDTLTATYSGDSSYNGSTGTASVTVAKATPTLSVTPSLSSITPLQALNVTITVTGTPAATGTVTLISGSYSSGTVTLANGSASVNIPAGSLALGSDTLSASYGGDTNYNANTGTASVTVSKITPTMTVAPGSGSITNTQALTVTVTLSGGGSNPAPTGSVLLAGGGYTSSSVTLSSGGALFNIPAGSLAAGSDTLTVTYTPDAGSSSIYNGTMGTGSVTVASSTTFTLAVNSVGPSSGISITASPKDNNNTASGSTPFTLTYNSGTQVTLSAAQLDNGYTFVSWSGCASTSGTSCTVTLNANTTVTVTYNAPGITSITLACTTVSTSASCSSSSSVGTVAIGTQAQFAATVNGTGAFSKGVTWSIAAPSGSSLSPGDISSTGLYNTPYPAPATITVTATSTQNTSVSSTMTVTLSAPSATGPALAVDLDTPSTPSENPHTINPYVYGMNAFFLDPASEKTANPGILRWGGDDTSRYNYQNGMTNSASDYYFESFQGAADQFPNSSGSTNFTQFVQASDAAGSAALGTVPVLGWVTNGTQYACSFTQSAYPDQQSFQGGCGNGIETSGTDLFGNNTIAAITSISEPEPDITAGTTPAPGSVTSAWANGTWAGGWVNSLVTNSSYGNGASGKGVALWDLDNEPTWWDAVHRDVHPLPFTYDEVSNNGIGTALAIKTADPTALVSGPVIDNWWAYFYSKQDIENGYQQGPCYAPWSNPADRAAHSGTAMIEYYLQQFQKYSTSYGVRLLDYVDIHGYFEPDYPAGSSNSVGFTTAGDTQEQMTRMNGTRVFWDPTYTDPNYPQPNYNGAPNPSTNCSPALQAPQLIPMLETWVKNDYPGTKTGIDEYNFGGMESINGAVVQADILGIFGRQGLDMGALWPTQTYSTQQPGNYAFAMYRNYDGKDSTFGDTYLYATSSASGSDAEGQLAVYAAQRSSDSAVTVMVINKTYGPLTSTLSLQNSTVTSTTAQAYLYSAANLSAIAPQTAATVTPPSGGGTTSTITYTFPAQSITLLVVPD
jgi:hypothetical protein